MFRLQVKSLNSLLNVKMYCSMTKIKIFAASVSCYTEANAYGLEHIIQTAFSFHTNDSST